MTKYVPMPPSIEEVDRVEPLKATLEYFLAEIDAAWLPKVKAARTSSEEYEITQQWLRDRQHLTEPLMRKMADLTALNVPTMLVLKD